MNVPVTANYRGPHLDSFRFCEMCCSLTSFRFCYEDDCPKDDPLSQESFRKLKAATLKACLLHNKRIDGYRKSTNGLTKWLCLQHQGSRRNGA
ncbi:hypothetical protein SOVF_019410 [Spinacia oleracea]|nr:hypothetical protein SOVF_019410 [Spinacia oleracea]